MKPIRVIVIDDSAFMRKMISDILASDERIEVAATARNGEDGIKKTVELTPDVVTLDVEMPVMDGIAALREIMHRKPTPVVMLSSVTREGAEKTVQAISNGAVDFIAKPSGSISLDINEIRQEIIEKVIVATHSSIAKPRRNETQPVQPMKEIGTGSRLYAKTIAVVGASTGGPRALQRLLKDLPKDFAAPILIVQHIPAGFSKSLAERLNSLTQIHVKEAVHGEILQNRTAYIAPGNYHMRLRKAGTAYAIELSQEDPRHGHRPSVDVLFESLATIKKVNKIAAILTGMGSDGSAGIKQLKQEDSQTIVIAESQETSIVYGMPKAALETGYVDHIMHLSQIGEGLYSLVKRSRGK